MNRLDQLYDIQPNVVRLVGGFHDGERVTIGSHGWPTIWRMPGAPPEFDALDAPPFGEVLRHPTYQRTDSVNDSGERIYRYVGDQ